MSMLRLLAEFEDLEGPGFVVMPVGEDRYEVYSLPRGEKKVVAFRCTHQQLEQFLKGWMEGMRPDHQIKVE